MSCSDYKKLNSAYLDNTSSVSSVEHFTRGVTPSANIKFPDASQKIKDISTKIAQKGVVFDYGYIFEPLPDLPEKQQNGVELYQETTYEIPIDISSDPIVGSGTQYYFNKIDTSQPQTVDKKKIVSNKKVVAGFMRYKTDDTFSFVNKVSVENPLLYNEITGQRQAQVKKMKAWNNAMNSHQYDENRFVLFYKLKLTNASGNEYTTNNGFLSKRSNTDKLYLVVTCFGNHSDTNSRFGVIEVNADTNAPLDVKPQKNTLTFFVSMIGGSK